MNPRIRSLVIGSDALIGKAFVTQLLAEDPELYASSRREGSSPFLDLGDLRQPDWQSFYAEGYRYAIIAAAVSRISACEAEPETTRQINVDATLQLAQELSRAGITPVLFSSDYVFDGKQAPYDEQAPLSPLNAYGRQKAELETRLAAHCGENYLLLRLSKVYTHCPGDKTLLAEMASQLATGQVIRAATDQIFNPVWLNDVVQVVQALQARSVRGLYNLTGTQAWSRWEIARTLASTLGYAGASILPVRLADLKEPFVRPTNTSLSNARLQSLLNYPFCPLQSGMNELKQRLQQAAQVS